MFRMSKTSHSITIRASIKSFNYWEYLSSILVSSPFRTHAKSLWYVMLSGPTSTAHRSFIIEKSPHGTSSFWESNVLGVSPCFGRLISCSSHIATLCLRFGWRAKILNLNRNWRWLWLITLPLSNFVMCAKNLMIRYLHLYRSF